MPTGARTMGQLMQGTTGYGPRAADLNISSTYTLQVPSAYVKHGRRNASQHARLERLPEAGGWARRQTDPPYLPGPLEAVSRRRTV